MKNRKSKHPYMNAKNWAPGGSCVFWNKETHNISKYEQLRNELERPQGPVFRQRVLKNQLLLRQLVNVRS